jgi:hypothetical protein
MKDAKEKFFLVRESHCHGFSEDTEWTPAGWMANQGVDEYNRLNDQWLEITSSSKPLGSGQDLKRKIQMFYFASYNIDGFRRFVFESPFLSRFEVDPEQQEDMKTDDMALMLFAFDWLKFSLFGEGTLTPKPDSAA